MNNEDIEVLQSKIELQRALLTKHIHESITNLQSTVDKFTTKIYNELKEDISLITKGDDIVLIYPSLYFHGSDIAPFYDTRLDIIYYINLYNKKTKEFSKIKNPSAQLNEKLEKLQKENIEFSLEIATKTKMTLVATAIQGRLSDTKKY